LGRNDSLESLRGISPSLSPDYVSADDCGLFSDGESNARLYSFVGPFDRDGFSIIFNQICPSRNDGRSDQKNCDRDLQRNQTSRDIHRSSQQLSSPEHVSGFHPSIGLGMYGDKPSRNFHHHQQQQRHRQLYPDPASHGFSGLPLPATCGYPALSPLPAMTPSSTLFMQYSIAGR
jgi:hypothetical protein